MAIQCNRLCGFTFFPLFLISLWLLPGCMHRVYVNSSSIVNNDRLKTLNPENSIFISLDSKGNSLIEYELFAKISKHLKKLGFSVTQEADKTDYSLVCTYETKSEKKLRCEPMYVPGEKHVTTGSIEVPTCNKVGNITIYDTNTIDYCQKTEDEDSVCYVWTSYKEFTHTLEVRLYSKNVIVWRGVAMACSEDFNFLRYSNYLLFSLFKKFGQSSDGIVKEKLGPKNLTTYWNQD